MARKPLDPLEAVLRPIIEGQLRSFINDHPEVVGAVDWHKPTKDKSVSFVNSAAKRIMRDLLCSETRMRLEKVVSGTLRLETPDGEGPVVCGGAALDTLRESSGGDVEVSAASPPKPKRARRVGKAAQSLEADKLRRAMAELRKVQLGREQWLRKHCPEHRKGAWG